MHTPVASHALQLASVPAAQQLPLQSPLTHSVDALQEVPSTIFVTQLLPEM